MTKLYLVRHCEAEGNTLGLMQGRSDFGISGNAPKQLDLVSLRLRNVPFTAVYSSPLKRAFATAQAIDRYHGLGVRKDDGIMEIDMGDWESHSWEEIKRNYPDIVKVWDETPHLFQAPGGESVAHVAERMWEAVSAIARDNPGGTVCAVSHGCAIRSFLRAALGWPPEKQVDVPWGDNTAVSVVEFEDGKAHVVSMNDASHLPASLSVYRSGSIAGANVIGVQK